MILYYSGTGNSKYIAKRVATAIDDECLNLFDKLKNHDISEIHSERPFVIVTPTYGWQIPHILRDWLMDVKLTGNKDIYFVMNCGSDIANSAKYVVELCKKIGMNYKGCAEIIMPENYIAMFEVPDKEEALEIIDKAGPVIDMVSECISKGVAFPDKNISILDRMKSSIVNAVYYPVVVHAKKFYVKDTCIGCGKCATSCVTSNIEMVEGKPQWDDKCTHCMACVCGCPVEAIEYGNASKGKPRYQCVKR